MIWNAEMNNVQCKKVCVVLVDRANYGRLKPVMRAIDEHPHLDLQVVAAGTMVLERFDHPVKVVRQDGFPVDGEIYIELEGSTPSTMANAPSRSCAGGWRAARSSTPSRR